MNLFVVPSWYPTKIHPEGGTFFRERAHILSRNGLNITVISPVFHSFRDLFQRNKMTETWKQDQALAFAQKEKINLFPKCEQLAFRSYKSLTLRLVKKGIEKFGKPDGVFIHSSLWAGAALSSWLNQEKIPFAVSEHLMGFMRKNGLSTFQKKMITRTYQRAQAVVATSSTLKTNIVSQFPEAESKIRIIPNPADVQSFHARKSSGCPSPFRFIYVGLFRPEKRLDLLLDAFSKVKATHSECKLTLIGDGSLRKPIENQIKTLGLGSSVTLTGYLKKHQIADQLQNHDALVLSSDVETFGVAPIEAMASGLPVIATECGGPSDYITPETGLLVPKNDIQKLADGMVYLMNNYHQYSTEKIRSFVESRFGDEAYSDLVRSMFNDLKQTTF